MRLIITLTACAALGGCLDSSGGAASSDTTEATTDTVPSSADTATTTDTATAEDTKASTEDTKTGTEDTSVPPDTAECAAANEECALTSECCPGTFCPAEASDLAGLCKPLMSDGEVCYLDNWCASGVCNSEGTCGALECEDEGGECWYDDACCSGVCFYDVTNAYIPGQCGEPKPNGSFCSQDSWCASGNCYEGLCAAADCKAVEAECQGGWDCCTGVCSNEVQARYGPGECMERLPAGAVCYSDSWCASLSCNDELTCDAF